MATVYAIKREDGYYVDKGGRRTKSIPQMFLWNDREKAQEYLDGRQRNIYIPPYNKNGEETNVEEFWAQFEVVPVKVTF
jgi:hypothetical protein